MVVRLRNDIVQLMVLLILLSGCAWLSKAKKIPFEKSQKPETADSPVSQMPKDISQISPEVKGFFGEKLLKDWLVADTIFIVQTEFGNSNDSASIWYKTNLLPKREPVMLDSASRGKFKAIMTDAHSYGLGNQPIRPCAVFQVNWAFEVVGDSLGSSLLLVNNACRRIQLAGKSTDFLPGYDSLSSLSCHLLAHDTTFANQFCQTDTLSRK